MKFSEALDQTVCAFLKERAEGMMPIVNSSEYLHSTVELTLHIHNLAAGIDTENTPGETTISIILEWVMEAIRRYGLPDDIADWPLRVPIDEPLTNTDFTCSADEQGVDDIV